MDFNFKRTIAFVAAFCHLFSFSPAAYGAVPKVSGQRILIQSVDTDDSDFQEFVNQSSGYVTLESVRPPINASAPHQISSLQKLAEAEFLGEDPFKSLPIYTRITSMALDQDWDTESRSIIFTSFFRMAQLQPDQSQKYIKKAILFDSAQHPNPELIPPTLQAIFKNVQTELETKMMSFEPTATPTFYVNGVKNLNRIYPDALYRITFVSNIYGIKTEITKGDTAAELFPYGVPLVQGQCRNVVAVNPDVKDLNQSFVFTSKNCAPKLMASVASLTQAKLKANESQLSGALPTKSVQTEVVSLNLYPSSIDTEQIEASGSQAPMSNKGKLTKKQKTWIIVVSSIAAATLTAMLIQKQNDKPRNYVPTESSGF